MAVHISSIIQFMEFCIKETHKRQRHEESEQTLNELFAAERTFWIMKSVAENLGKEGIFKL